MYSSNYYEKTDKKLQHSNNLSTKMLKQSVIEQLLAKLKDNNTI